MKKHIAMLCAVLLTALAAFAPGAAAAGPALTATEAYCIIDADTGLVLAQQNMNERSEEHTSEPSHTTVSRMPSSA